MAGLMSGRPGRRDLLGLACAWFSVSFSVTVRAMGPGAPFVPPNAPPHASRTLSAAGWADTAAAPSPGLSGVRLHSGIGAMIDGQWVALGARVRGGRLEHVTRRYVVVRLANGQAERLDLYPSPAAAGASVPWTQPARPTAAKGG